MSNLFAEITEKGLVLNPVEGQPSFRSWEPFPGSGALFYLRQVDDRVIGWGLKTSFDHHDALAFMAGVTPEILDQVSESAPLAIRQAATKPFGRFTHLCIVYPTWAQFSLNAKTDFMLTRVHQVLPCFRCEFTDDDSFAEFDCRRRWDGVKLNDPFREPHPALSMRYEHLRPKRTGSSGGKKMGIFTWEIVRKHVLMLPEADGFVDLENFERVRLNITHRDGLWHVMEKKRRWEPFADGIEPWLTALCFEGREAAEATIQR